MRYVFLLLIRHCADSYPGLRYQPLPAGSAFHRYRHHFEHIGGFFFEDRVVIDSFKQKNEIYRGIVHQIVTYSNTNVTVISGDARIVYQVDYYNDQRETITNALILIRGPAGAFKTRIDAE